MGHLDLFHLDVDKRFSLDKFPEPTSNIQINACLCGSFHRILCPLSRYSWLNRDSYLDYDRLLRKRTIVAFKTRSYLKKHCPSGTWLENSINLRYEGAPRMSRNAHCKSANKVFSQVILNPTVPVNSQRYQLESSVHQAGIRQ